MRKFSEELIKKEEREFEVGGELFQWRYPYWEEFADRAEADMKIATGTPGVPGPDGEVVPEQTVKDIYQDFINRIEMYIEPENDSVKRWRTLAKRKVDPVPAYVFVELYQWLVGVTSNRPTELPSLLGNGQGPTEPSSTEGSS